MRRLIFIIRIPLLVGILWAFLPNISVGAEPNIAGGFKHVAALKDDGTVWTWGNNEGGQLGDGTTTPRTTPVLVKDLNDVITVSASGFHTAALKRDGTVWTWGDNSYGQLGDGTFTSRTIPAPVKDLNDVIAINTKGSFTVAVKNDGTVWIWGCCHILYGLSDPSPVPALVPGLNGVIAIAAGGGSTLALKADGTVWAWGSNYFGEVGDGTTITRTTPVQVAGLSEISVIAAGYDYSVALKSDGTVWAWGRNLHGQLGDGTVLQHITPVPVSGLTDVVAIAANPAQPSFTVALKRDGTVWAWGDHHGVQTGSTVPVPVPSLTNSKVITAGGFLTHVFKSDGTVWGWGWNESGALGNGTIVNSYNPTQVLDTGGSGFLNLGQSTTTTPPPPEIVLTLEEPAEGSTYSGVGNVRGWAVAPQGLDSIELYVDGVLTGNIPLGGQRSDVGAAYPNYPDSTASGFAMAFNYANLTAGSHTFRVHATDKTGDVRDTTATFTVTRFANPYITDPAAVNLDQATVTVNGNVLTIQNLLAENQPYDVKLDWWPATQNFALTEINPIGRRSKLLELNEEQSTLLVGSTLVQQDDDNATLVCRCPPEDIACNEIVLTLEEPAEGNIYSGIANVRGWAVAPQRLDKIELYVDGVLRSNIPLGGKRSDVGAAYPAYPDSADSGFAMAFNYSGLSAGDHLLTVCAIDNTGAIQQANATFNVVRFEQAYIADPAAINLNQAIVGVGNSSMLRIQDLVADGKRYNVQLDWRTAAQGFAMTRITSQDECIASLSPSIIGIEPKGGTGSINVSIQGNCSWTAQSYFRWITITSDTRETGSGAITYSVLENPSCPRTGTLIIAGQIFTILQYGDCSGGR